MASLVACGGVQTSPAPVEDRGDTTTVDQQRGSPERIKVPPVSPAEENVSGVADGTDTATDLPVKATDATVDSEAGPVVLAFLDEAETLAASGDSQRAIASLERGIRIKPKDPWLWHQLGVMKLRTGEWLDAISIAEKSNSLAGNNRQLLIGNWLVIADANESLGNPEKAKSARQMAEKISDR
ncbi:MAG: hypothetical protein R3318_03070 [Gammaproteobacteria bacterium]|nr:hypothetical protein [Gammaproteobacteria bacterium]